MKQFPNATDRKIGALIKTARTATGTSQTALGTHLGVSFQQVQKYENGTNRVSAQTLAKIARHLGTPIPFFFGDHPVNASASRDVAGAAAALGKIRNRKTRAMVVRMVHHMVAAVEVSA